MSDAVKIIEVEYDRELEMWLVIVADKIVAMRKIQLLAKEEAKVVGMALDACGVAYEKKGWSFV